MGASQYNFSYFADGMMLNCVFATDEKDSYFDLNVSEVISLGIDYKPALASVNDLASNKLRFM